MLPNLGSKRRFRTASREAAEQSTNPALKIVLFAILLFRLRILCFVQVEFVEEIIDGEVLINAFGTPYDNGDGLWNVMSLSSLYTIFVHQESFRDISDKFGFPCYHRVAQGEEQQQKHKL